MTLRSISRALGLLFLLLLGACSRTELGARGLRFTAIPDDNTTELAEKFGPVADYLAAELGVPVEYVPTSSYSASVEAFKNGDVQLAWFGGLTGVQARSAVPGARAVAQGTVDPNYKSYFIAHRDAGLERSEDFPMALEGKRFTFGSESSTSGRLMPESFIRRYAGRSPEAFFGTRNHYSGSHDKTALLVQAGTFEAGAINYKTYDRMVESGQVDPEVCSVIWVSPEYADYNWTVHPLVEEWFGTGTIERIRTALVGMRAPELLRAVDREGGLITAENEDFASIRALAEELDFLR